MRRIKRIAGILSIATLLAACGMGSFDPSAIGKSSQYGEVTNGQEINGQEINGQEINGQEINGQEINGQEINGVSLHGTAFSGTTSDGSSISGIDFIGVTLKRALSSGVVLHLRVDSIQPGTAPNDDLLFYSVSYQTSTGWKSLCGTDSTGTPRLAIPLHGWWDKTGAHIADPSRFTFACRRAALAKCVELGYKPWQTVNGVSLAAHHQACTRMIRADYCGDGRSWTVDGRFINVHDGIGIQSDTENWTSEAEWDANGARCVNKMRVRYIEEKGLVLPSCLRDRIASTCGSEPQYQSGSLLVNEFQSPLVVHRGIRTRGSVKRLVSWGFRIPKSPAR